MIKPYKVTHDKFTNLGIKGKQPAISCAVVVDQEVAKLLEHNLITLGHRMSAMKIQDFREHKITLTPVVPNLKGKAGWDSSIKAQDSSRQPRAVKQCKASKLSEKGCKRELEHATFQCPQCNERTACTNASIQLHDLDKVYKCKSCKAKVKIRDWMCPCLNRWHLCVIHKSCCSYEGKRKPPCSMPSQCPKRMLGPLSREQLQEIDNKRMRKSNMHILPPAPNILSANLRDRFAHLF